MKLSYSGKTEKLTPSQERKIQARVSKIEKLLGRRSGDQEAHVTLRAERHLQHAEVALQFFDHPMLGTASETDQFTAVINALDRLEKQLLRQRTKWRDTKRGSAVKAPAAAPAAKSGEKAKSAKPPKAAKAAKATAPARVVRAGQKGNGKPMTVEEAVIALEGDRDYVVYRDAETDKVSVLVRRRDGKMDLIEA